MSFEHAGQILIAITGTIAIWLTQQHREKWKRYAGIIGLLGQPAWLISSYQSELWGVFAMSIFYTYAWCLGIKNSWFTVSGASQ